MCVSMRSVLFLLLVLLAPGALRAEDAASEPRNLLISLRRHGYPGTQTMIDSQAGIHNESAGRIATVRGATQQPHVVTRGSVHVSTATREREEQSVRALEGRAVVIHEGRLVPLALGGEWAAIDYTELSERFEVTAHLDGARVTLDLVAVSERMEDGAPRSSSIESSVSGRLGEWIWLGGTSGEGPAPAEGINPTASTAPRDGTEWEVKVEYAR
jgi:hypothetical protein